MFDENEILVFNRDTYNYLKDYRIKSVFGNDKEISQHGTVYKSATSIIKVHDYLIVEALQFGYEVIKDGEIVMEFDTQDEANFYVEEMKKQDELKYRKQQFGHIEKISRKDYLHIGTNNDAGYVILIDYEGEIIKRDF